MNTHTRTHLCDLKDRDRLLGALSMRQQQLQLSISVKVSHGTTCWERNTFTTTQPRMTASDKKHERTNLKIADQFLVPVARQHLQHLAPQSKGPHLPFWTP